MAPSLTPFCPNCPDNINGGGTPHAEIRAQFPKAPYCPHCNQSFSNASINNAPSNDPIDLTADSPVPRRRVRTQQQQRALTVPVISTTRATPGDYHLSIVQAQHSREESIQQNPGEDHGKETIIVQIQAVFWVADGQLDYSFDGIQTYIFNQTPRIAQRSQGQMKLPLKSKFSTHEAMIQTIIDRLLTSTTQSGRKGWTVVSHVGEKGSSMGPSFFPLAAYESISIGQFLFHSGINPVSTKDTHRVTLHFWKFIQRELSEMKRKRRADYILSDIDSEVSQSPSPKKNRNLPKRPRRKAIKTETIKEEIKAETIKAEPSAVMSEPQSDAMADSSVYAQRDTEIDPFVDYNADVFDDAALNAELVVVGLSPEPLLNEDESPVRRQSSRSTKGKARPRD